jgi:hypothetical protein
MISKRGQLAEQHERSRTLPDSFINCRKVREQCGSRDVGAKYCRDNQSGLQTATPILLVFKPRGQLTQDRKGVLGCRVALKGSAADRSGYNVG